MTRRRFSEREVIATLIHQGVEVRCYRTKEPITLESVKRLEREHVHEVGLGGADEPENCRYSLSEAHAIVTNGTKATSAGSSKHKVAKDRRLKVARLAKREVEKRVSSSKWRLKKKVSGEVVRVRTR